MRDPLAGTRVRALWSFGYPCAAVIAIGVLAAVPGAPILLPTFVILAIGLLGPGVWWLRAASVSTVVTVGVLADWPLALGHWRDGNPLAGEGGVVDPAGLLVAATAMATYMAVVVAVLRSRHH